MTKKLLILATGVVGMLAASALPASAQVQDFFCNTFTIGCPDAPPPPPPAAIPVQSADPAPEAAKPRHHVKKKKVAKAKVAKAEKADKGGDAAEPK